MSYWTYINGIIEVEPSGRTQAEKTYVLETVLNHLPVVTGSEGDMEVYVNQKYGHNSSSSCDEYGEDTNNLRNWYGDRSQKEGWLRVQTDYIISVSSAFRDRMFEQTFHEFVNWLCRLAKRVTVSYVDVVVRDCMGKTYRIHDSGYGAFHYMDEIWNKDKEPHWTDHLMWKRAKNSWYPAELEYKYYNDEENDKRVEDYLSVYKEEN